MRAAALALALALVVLPDVAAACPVCGTATEGTEQALLGNTIAMSLFPLFLIFGGMGLLWWYAGKPSFEERHAGEIRQS